MSEEETLILESVDQFLERDVRPHVRALEAADEYPQAIADRMAELRPHVGGFLVTDRMLGMFKRKPDAT